MTIRLPKIRMSPAQLGSVIAGIAAYAFLRGAQINTSGGTPNPPPIGGPAGWAPKWHIGDVLVSHNLAGARWIVKGHDFQARQYIVDFTFAGTTTYDMRVDATALEDSTIYY